MSRKRNWMLFVNAGISLFVCLYFAATLLYPGGSQTDTFSSGFSCTDNYWCNLLDLKAINGSQNSARPLALSALLMLCLALMFFWYWFPVYAGMGTAGILITRYSGMAAMGTAFFLFIGPHDLIINAASLFGLVSVFGTLAGLHHLKWDWLLRMGIFNLIMVGFNNLCYYNKSLLIFLPVVQKITFLFFLLWISWISLRLSKSK
jgi:hypothetical protein